MDAVAGEGDGAGDLGGVGVGVQERALGDNVDRAALAEVVELSGVELDLEALAGGDDLESVLAQARGGDLETDAVKVDLVACSRVSMSLTSVDGTCRVRISYRQRKPQPSRRGRCRGRYRS